MGMTEWVSVGIASLPLLGLVLWWWNELWYAVPLMRANKRLPPGHMGLPFIGDMLAFLFYFKLLRRPDEYINAKRRKYGDKIGVFRSHLFGSACIIACGPSVNKFVLQSSEEKFESEWPTVAIVGTTSLVAVHGKEHAILRSFVLNAINSPNSLRRITLFVQPRILSALQSWANNLKINAHLETKKVTFENIAKLFGSKEAGGELERIDKLFEGMIKGVRAYPRINIPGFAYHSAVKCRKKAEQIFWRELDKRRRRNTTSSSEGEGEGDTNDLMDGLMQIRDDEGNLLSDKHVVDNIITLIIAGYVSTALVAMWAIYYLAKFPIVLTKLREENMALKNAKTGEFITYEQLSGLKYTNKVVEETIRMANVSAFSFRKVVKETEYKGYDFPKGWNVILWTRYLHTNPENFEDPLCFNPDRWNEAVKAGTYQVFGGGARTCAGNMLARLQLAILLHHLSTGYKWELVNPKAGVIYLPLPMPEDGVEIMFSKL